MRNDRAKTDFFIRAADYGVKDDQRTIRGVIPFNSDSVDMWGVTERILPTAFNKTLSDRAEVKCLLGHDSSKILGSSGAGTLRMSAEADGLHFEVDLPNTTDGNDAYELIRRGDCRTLSFGFIPVKTQNTELPDGRELRELVEVNLMEISVCVAFPAYPEGNTSIRSFFAECGTNIDDLNQIIRRQGSLSDGDRKKINTVAKKLSALIRTADPAQQPDEGTESDTETQPHEDTETGKNERERFIFYMKHQGA